MRQLKFRAWDNRDKKWLLGYDKPHLGGFSLFGECMMFGEWSGILSRFVRAEMNPDDLIVEQSTGLHDKNGSEIYEGDIGCWHHGYCIHCGEKANELIYEIKLDAIQGATMMSQPIWNYLGDIEIIGNIHEHHDLLEANHQGVQDDS